MSIQEEAGLILKLYELRREETMRKARDWYFRDFNPQSMADFSAAIFGEHSGHVRMVVTYWEMAASFITAGVLHQELFLQSGQELLFVWEKIRDIVPEWRTAYGNPKIMANVETVSKAAIEFMNRGNAKAYETFSARVRGIR